MYRFNLIIRVALAVVLLVVPLYADTSLLQAGTFMMAAVVGAAGLVLLFGTAGQLSLAHSFFLALGAYAYAVLSTPSSPGTDGLVALGLPPVVSVVGALACTGVAGYAFSLISRRLGGVYLGIASLSLVFIGIYLMHDMHDLTGGFNGRSIDPSAYPGIFFVDASIDVTVAGVPFGTSEKLWYFALIITSLALVVARNIQSRRPGRALQTIRDGEIAAAVVGIDVRRYKASIFTVSSMFAGMAGILYALCSAYIVPDSFGLAMSLDYIAIIVIGGMASLSGSVLGAAFVILMPQLLTIYSSDVPFLSEPGSGGLDASTVSRLVYGLAIIVVLRFIPGGFAQLLSRRRKSIIAPPPPPSVTTDDRETTLLSN